MSLQSAVGSSGLSRRSSCITCDAGALVGLYPTTLFYLINALTNSNNKVTIQRDMSILDGGGHAQKHNEHVSSVGPGWPG